MTAILIDGRCSNASQAAFLDGFITSLSRAHADWHLSMALDKSCALPALLESRASSFYLPHGVELFWPHLGRGFDLFVSPAARLPLLPMPCPMVHVVHDASLPTGGLGQYRLRRALATARLTWFDSVRVQQACEAWAGRPLPAGTVRPPDEWGLYLQDIETALGSC